MGDLSVKVTVLGHASEEDEEFFEEIQAYIELEGGSFGEKCEKGAQERPPLYPVSEGRLLKFFDLLKNAEEDFEVEKTYQIEERVSPELASLMEKRSFGYDLSMVGFEFRRKVLKEGKHGDVYPVNNIVFFRGSIINLRSAVKKWREIKKKIKSKRIILPREKCLSEGGKLCLEKLSKIQRCALLLRRNFLEEFNDTHLVKEMVIEVCPSLPEFLNKDKPIIVVVGWIKKENKNGEEGEDELSQAADEVVYKFKNLFDEFVSRTAVQIDGVHPVMYTPAYLEVNGRDFGVIAGHHESDDDARDVKFDIEIKPNDQSRVMKYFYPENIWRKDLFSLAGTLNYENHPTLSVKLKDCKIDETLVKALFLRRAFRQKLPQQTYYIDLHGEKNQVRKYEQFLKKLSREHTTKLGKLQEGDINFDQLVKRIGKSTDELAAVFRRSRSMKHILMLEGEYSSFQFVKQTDGDKIVKIVGNKEILPEVEKRVGDIIVSYFTQEFGTKEIELTSPKSQLFWQQTSHWNGVSPKLTITRASSGPDRGGSIGNVSILLKKCDFQDVGTEAIAFSANEILEHDGGLSRVISQAGGPEFQRDSNSLAPLRPGHAIAQKAPEGSDLAGYVKYVIPGVVPSFYEDFDSKHSLLTYQATIRECLQKADLVRVKSLALPLFGGGLLGWPPQVAVKELIRGIQVWEAESGASRSVESIVLFDRCPEKVEKLWEGLMLSACLGNCLISPRVPKYRWFKQTQSGEKEYYDPEDALRLDLGLKRGQRSVLLESKKQNILRSLDMELFRYVVDLKEGFQYDLEEFGQGEPLQRVVVGKEEIQDPMKIAEFKEENNRFCEMEKRLNKFIVGEGGRIVLFGVKREIEEEKERILKIFE